MEEPPQGIERIGAFLRFLSALQVTVSVGLLTATVLTVNIRILEQLGGELQMSGRSVLAVAVILLLLLLASGLVSLYRIRYGWIFSFLVASLTLLAGLLLGAGTIPVTVISFPVLLFLSLLTWAAATVHYFWDLYT